MDFSVTKTERRPAPAHLRHVPNLLSWARIALAPPLAGLIVCGVTGPALGVFVLGAASDAADGLLARRLRVQTAFGAELDPLADKIFVLSALAALCATAALPAWAALLVGLMALREAAVTVLRLQRRGSAPVKTSRAAKWKTALQMASAGLLIAAQMAPAASALRGMGLTALAAAAGLSMQSGWIYWRARG